jgi:hypothetical protein
MMGARLHVLVGVMTLLGPACAHGSALTGGDRGCGSETNGSGDGFTACLRGLPCSSFSLAVRRGSAEYGACP